MAKLISIYHGYLSIAGKYIKTVKTKLRSKPSDRRRMLKDVCDFKKDN